MKGYSIHRLESNPSSNGFSQITACSPIKSASHSKLLIVSVSQPGCVCVCVYDLCVTGDLCVLSLSDKSLQRPRKQRDWLRVEPTYTHTRTHKRTHPFACIHTQKCTQEEAGVSRLCINRVVR